MEYYNVPIYQRSQSVFQAFHIHYISFSLFSLSLSLLLLLLHTSRVEQNEIRCRIETLQKLQCSERKSECESERAVNGRFCESKLIQYIVYWMLFAHECHWVGNDLRLIFTHFDWHDEHLSNCLAIAFLFSKINRKTVDSTSQVPIQFEPST